MKGIVMEINGKDLVVLKKSGEYIKMKKEGRIVCVGQEIDFAGGNRNGKWAARRLTALAASLLIFIGAGAGGYAYYAPTGYVDVDINPGVELAYNRWDKVIKVSGANEDGERVLEIAGNLKNKGVGTAVKMILEAAEDEEFLSGDAENFVNVFVSGKNNSENLEKAKNAIENHHEETGLQFFYNAEKGTLEKYKAFKAEAEGLNITPGKLNLLRKVYGENEKADKNSNRDSENSEGESFEKFAEGNKDLSVKDIMQSFNRGKGKGDEVKDKGDEVKEQDEENGNEENGNTGKGNNSGKGNK
ncbi:MAG TPA: anti-sigma factor domain-containing protein [Clostridia bacterium]|nr:anti-sigma factor domain-containing protein [Clostridia bacterium]